MPSSDPTDDFIEAAANALGISLDPAWKPAVRGHLEVSRKLAHLMDEFPLPDDAEPAPVFKA
ncbi:MAG TPA: DUF4089 domain-containing protein [Pseudorhodoplanes sp.]|nr:DUF4089 domain-containing protein [Pseudorhodoplanes sp.]